MNTKQARPKWWQLYLAFPVFAGFALLDARSPLSMGGHEALQAAALLIAVGWTHRWVRLNASALRAVDNDTYLGTVIIHTYSVTGPSTTPVLEDSAPSAFDSDEQRDFNQAARPALRLPRESELVQK